LFRKTILAAVAVGALLGGAGVSAARADTHDRHIFLVNHSHETIVEFHASNVNRQSWEEDILGRSVVRPGQTARINIDDGSGHCMFDFLTKLQSGATIERRGVDVCSLETYTVTD
jgi:hypothetical protein